MEHSITYFDPFPVLDSAPTTTTISTQHAHDAPLVDMPEAAEMAAVAPIAMEEERFSVEYEGPLYTEINIPLPRVPTKYAKNTTASSSKSSAAAGITATSSLAPQEQEKSSRSRSRTLSSLSAFRNRRFSSSSSTSSSSTVTSPTSPKSSGRHSEDWPRVRRDVVKSREVNAMMDLKHQGKKRSRNGTIDALAVVPAVLVLSAELFTPGENGAGKRKDSGVGRWEDGIR